MIKGESSYWINKTGLLSEKSGVHDPAKFECQEEYYAVLVSESILENLRRHIKNQEEHHRKKTNVEE